MKYSVGKLINLDKEFDFEFFYSGAFSQWKSCKFYEDGIMFTTAEQYMMFYKAILFGDNEIARQILSLRNPSQIKRLGRLVKGFDERIWNENKYEIVKRGNLLKFSQNSELRKILIDTGDKILVEASPVDTIWGIGLSEVDPRRKDVRSWRGQNLLGFALVEVREVLKEFEK